MKPTTDDLRQLLDLPEQIAVQERQINGMKSDKAKKTRELDAMEARHRIRISQTGDYTNAEDRKAALLIALDDDPKYSAITERLDQLNGTIRAAEAQRDLLRRKRASLQTQAGLFIVNRLDELVKDKDVVAAVGGKWLA